MRLDKFLAHHLGISRTMVSRELRAGNITVDDVVIKTGAYQISAEQIIKYQDNILKQINDKRYFMLHKPQGYVCSNDDPEHPIIFHFIDEPMVERLHAVGRLDLDTTGLVLITDDGQWSHRITSPKHHCDKIYLVEVEHPLTVDLVQLFLDGLQLNGEKHLTKPARLEILDKYHARLTINEGKYHQVKRMFAAVNNRVITLHREQIGAIKLDISSGEYRALTTEEINSF